MWWRRDNDEEDPFARLRDGTAGSATSTATRRPVADHTTVSGVPGAEGEPAVARQPGSRAPRRRRGSDRLLVLLLIVVSLGASAALIVREEQAAPDGPRAQADPAPGGDADPADPTPGDPGGGRAGQGKPPPPRTYDLVRPDGMRGALRAMRRKMGPREVVDSLRVAPDRINAVVHSPQSERQRSIDVADDLSVDVTASGQRAGGGLRLAQIDPAAPWRAVRNAARAGGFRTGKLDYLVLSPSFSSLTRPTWSLFFDGVRLRNNHWTATLDGRVVHRPGELPGGGSSTTTLTIINNGVRTVLRGDEARRVSDCVRRARERNADISGCLP